MAWEKIRNSIATIHILFAPLKPRLIKVWKKIRKIISTLLMLLISFIVMQNVRLWLDTGLRWSVYSKDLMCGSIIDIVKSTKINKYFIWIPKKEE